MKRLIKYVKSWIFNSQRSGRPQLTADEMIKALIITFKTEPRRMVSKREMKVYILLQREKRYSLNAGEIVEIIGETKDKGWWCGYFTVRFKKIICVVNINDFEDFSFSA